MQKNGQNKKVTDFVTSIGFHFGEVFWEFYSKYRKMMCANRNIYKGTCVNKNIEKVNGIWCIYDGISLTFSSTAFCSNSKLFAVCLPALCLLHMVM